MLKTTTPQSGFSKRWTNARKDYTKMCPCGTRQGKVPGARLSGQVGSRHRKRKTTRSR